MDLNRRRYPAKLLLFGEHLIVRGSQGLAFPVLQFHGHWQYGKMKDTKLERFLEYLEKLDNPLIELNKFKSEIQKGLYFSSDIPRGAGLGSSGALCAAIFDQFGLSQQLSLSDLKWQLAQLESFFHGKSSGLDPLVSYLDQPVKQHIDGSLSIVNLPLTGQPAKGAFFIVDTHLVRSTVPMVKLFQEKYREKAFRQLCETQLVPCTEEAIESLIKGCWPVLFESLHQISFFQLRYMSEMIPSAFRQIWLDGLASSTFKLKLCGAGGGGFLLGLSKDWPATLAELKDYHVFGITYFNP